MQRLVEVENAGDCIVISFNRPEVRNPISAAVIAEIEQTLKVAKDGAIRKLVFTGRGESFASGADLAEIALLDGPDVEAFARLGQAFMDSVARLPCETVAAVNGFCFGGALDLALACDRRLASPNASFCHPGVGLGIITGWGGTQRLPRLVGESGALQMFLTAAPITAHEALRLGLIDAIVGDPLAAAIGS